MSDSELPNIVTVAAGFPPHYYDQEAIIAMISSGYWRDKGANLSRLAQFHRHMMVDGRHLAVPIEKYASGELAGFGARNDAWIEAATDLGEATIRDLLAQAGVAADAVGQLVTTTVTGMATPALDARLMNRIPFSPQMKRVPLFGLGCVGGAAGVARVADYLRAFPDEVAILLSVELCSLTFQLSDISVANIVSSGLFGDGAAAVLMAGHAHPSARRGKVRVVDSRSFFFPDTERVMGWDVVDTGFKVVLSAAVPDIARGEVRPAVEAFLADHNLSQEEISHWIAHPGGPKVIQALADGLGLEDGALALSSESLAKVGNLSSASILLILKETMARYQPAAGTYGLMIAMGPAFCAELVLLQW
jgi:alkylresorcinol/alkylpyrone synthase